MREIADRAKQRVSEEASPLFGPSHEQRSKYREAIRQIEEEFAASLSEEYLEPSAQPASKKVFDYAWAEGHSEGYHMVEQIYEEIAEIANAAAKGGK